MMGDNMKRSSTLPKLFLLLAVCLIFLFLQSAFSPAPDPDDWPQWRGPNRDGKSNETGLLKTWPTNGPRVIWKKAIGDGYSSITVVGNRLYTAYAEGSGEVLFCLDTNSGEESWRFVLNKKFNEEYGDGPRSAPIVEGNVVYAMGSLGKLYAFERMTGKQVWRVDIEQLYGTGDLDRGYASSPLIYKNLLILNAGRKAGKTIIALNKKTGAFVWGSQTGLPSYSSPMLFTVNSSQQIVSFIGYGVVGVSPDDGKELWKYRWETSWGLNIATPLFIAPDKILISSGYDKGAALLKLSTTGGKWSIEKVWDNRLFRNHFNSSVLHDGHIYGFDESALKCIDARTGEGKWATRDYRKGSLLFADGHLIVLGEQGLLALVEANPTAFKEMARVQILRGKCWTMPTLANGKLYLRNQSEMVCLDVSGN